jgi:ATP-dependent DNA ligase
MANTSAAPAESEPSSDSLDDLLGDAHAHAATGDTRMWVADFERMLNIAWSLMTPEQRIRQRASRDSGAYRGRGRIINTTVSTAPRRRRSARPTTAAGGFPDWVAPQLTKLVETVPEGDQWAHEIKLDGYRMHARVDRGRVRLLTRTGLDWTDKYPSTAEAFTALPIEQAYVDGELCAVAENGVTSFSLMQAATDSRRTASLIYFAFDLLYVDVENLIQAPLIERKRRLDTVLHGHAGPIRYCDHQVGRGPEFHTTGVGRCCLQASRRTIHPERSRPEAQNQMPQPRGVCDCRLDRPGRHAARSCWRITTRRVG